MRDDRAGAGAMRRWAPMALAGMLLSWLVVQNAVLLLLVSRPGMPALMSIARALFKAAVFLAVQMAPAALIVAGTVLLCLAAGRAVRAGEGRLGDARRA